LKMNIESPLPLLNVDSGSAVASVSAIVTVWAPDGLVGLFVAPVSVA